MNAYFYISILENELDQSLEYWKKEIKSVFFQQNNNFKHTSKKTKNWLKGHGFTTIVWPPQFPDLNFIQYLWNHIKRKLEEYENKSRKVEELYEKIQKKQKNDRKKVYQNLISSMPRKVKAILKTKRDYTKYQ